MGREAASQSKLSQNRAERRPASERRAEILQTAMKAFAQKGYRDTGTAGIAGEIGITEPTLYRYFKSKRSLYLEALELGHEEILGSWQRIAQEASSPLQALLQLGTWYFEELQRDSSALMLRARAEVDSEDPEVRERLTKQFLATLDFVRRLHQAAQEQGLLAPDLDLEARTWLFMSLGAMVDRTHLLGVGDELRPEEIGRVFLSLAPELAALPAPRAAERNKDGPKG